MFYRNIDNLKIISGDNLDYIKTKIKDLALTSFHNYNANIPQHISNEAGLHIWAGEWRISPELPHLIAEQNFAGGLKCYDSRST